MTDRNFDFAQACGGDEAATSDVGGTLDLMLTFVEMGNRFTKQFGDVDGPFYDAVLGMMEQFAKRVREGCGGEGFL